MNLFCSILSLDNNFYLHNNFLLYDQNRFKTFLKEFKLLLNPDIVITIQFRKSQSLI